MEKQEVPTERKLLPTWLLIAWLPVWAAQIWLNASIIRRDGFGWGRMAIVIAASILVGMVITDLLEVNHRRRVSRAHREPAVHQKSFTQP